MFVRNMLTVPFKFLLQDTYYAVQRAKGKKNRHTGQRWQTAIIGELWTQWTTVWSIRNNDVHGSDAIARQQAITREVRRDLRSIYDTRSHMEPSAQALLFDTLEEHMTQPTWVIKKWMAIHVPGIKARLRRNCTPAGHHTRSAKRPPIHLRHPQPHGT